MSLLQIKLEEIPLTQFGEKLCQKKKKKHISLLQIRLKKILQT
jgi:hypothetical protein